jgi:ubiquinone/menaquinone biosynthesis C-methylase UbiE
MDYSRAKTRREVLIRQRRDLWTPEQVESLARHFGLKPGTKLLDAGCGFGYAMRTWGSFCMPGGELTGLDRDKRLLAQAARFCKKEGLGKAARFVCSDIHQMPFPDNTFDVSLVHVVLIHLAEPEKVLDELIRVTRRGGCVAAFEPARSFGSSTGWSSWHEPGIREWLLEAEVEARMKTGRVKVGFGDFGVGLHLPAWMEARRLENVDARGNERVYWMAPPYRSPAQQTSYRNVVERMAESAKNRPHWDRVKKTTLDQMRAGGLSRRKYDEHLLLVRTLRRAFRKAMKDGTAASSGSSAFWCVWGFKP